MSFYHISIRVATLIETTTKFKKLTIRAYGFSRFYPYPYPQGSTPEVIAVHVRQRNEKVRSKSSSTVTNRHTDRYR